MKIGCILVLYKQDEDLINKILTKITKQVEEVYLVDNSSFDQSYLFDLTGNISYLNLKENKGIATAQNKGIEYFLKKKFDYILFLDQDSIPPNNLVNTLVKNIELLMSSNLKVGGVGPRPYNRERNAIYKGSVMKGKSFNDDITEVTELISSSSLIPIQNFIDVGLMEDELFIDGVDHEWCWRGSSRSKLKFFIIETVLLSHQLGEGDRSFLFKKVAIPTPFRTYYQFRNYFKLVKRNYVPLYWKLANGFKYTIKYFYFPIFVAPKFEYFKMINKGIIDGIFKK